MNVMTVTPRTRAQILKDCEPREFAKFGADRVQILEMRLATLLAEAERLENEWALERSFHDSVSVKVACSSADGSAELGQLDNALAIVNADIKTRQYAWQYARSVSGMERLMPAAATETVVRFLNNFRKGLERFVLPKSEEDRLWQETLRLGP